MQISQSLKPIISHKPINLKQKILDNFLKKNFLNNYKIKLLKLEAEIYQSIARLNLKQLNMLKLKLNKIKIVGNNIL